jgi:radical SAM protein with 4Fe4S-binding SPASM domain
MEDQVYLQWHITNKCNNKCKGCYQEKFDGSEVDERIAEKILKDFYLFGEKLNADKSLAITGGDPLLNNDFWAIISLARKHADNLRLLANPELLDEHSLEKLKEIGIDGIQLSLDGLKKTHDKLRYNGSFNATLKAIERIKKANITIDILTTVSSTNYQEIIKIINYLRSTGVDHWSFSRLISPKGTGLTPKTYYRLLQDILKHSDKILKKDSFLYKEPLLSYFHSDKINTGINKIRGGCGLGMAKFALLPDNTLMACRRHPESKLGKWSAENNFIYHFLFNAKMQEYRRLREIKKCQDCDLLYYCRGCRAAAYMEKGNTFDVDPLCFVY